MSNTEEKLYLGKENNVDVELSPLTLQTHCAIIGTTGCGKTVAGKILIEELALKGIPVIAVDPHGDVSSLVFPEDNQDTIEKNNISSKKLKKFKEDVEVLIWTPGSNKGIPLCLNPLKFDDIPTDTEDRIKYLSYSAQVLASALDYDAKSEKTIYSILNVIFEYYISKDIDISNFTKLINEISTLPDELLERIDRLGDKKDIKLLIEKLSRFTVGAESLLYNTGMPLDIDMLLGTKSKSGKTRISIIYLNSLSTIKEQEFFISMLNQKIYHWMKRNSLDNKKNKHLKCGYFIDEISPWIPPVKKPLCKDSFERLFKESRKFGLSLIVATQSPGDIDYKVIAQVNTTLLGRIQTSQEINKVKTKIKSKSNLEIEEILTKLPSLETGTFLILSSEYKKAVAAQLRWLITKHGTDASGKNWMMSLNDIKKITNDTKKQIIDEHETQESKDINEINQNNEDQNNSTNLKNQKEINVKDKHLYDNDIVYMVKHKIYQRDVTTKIKKYLKGGLIFKTEEYFDSKFDYMQLIRVELSYNKQTGFFVKNEQKVDNINLYLNRVKDTSNNEEEYQILTYDGNEVVFKSIIDEHPDEIEDLDDRCQIEIITRSEARKEFEFRGRTRLSDIKKDVISIMEKKYHIEIKKVDWLLFPIWKCTINDKKEKDLKRNVYIDAVSGNRIKI